MMSNTDVARAVEFCREKLIAACGPVAPVKNPEAWTEVDRARHVAYMLDEIPRFMAVGKREKAMRWLGFAQGFLWTARMADIEELKEANIPARDLDVARSD
jgi:hypothetical protein